MLLFGKAAFWLYRAVRCISSEHLIMYRRNSNKLQLGRLARSKSQAFCIVISILHKNITTFWYALVSCNYLRFDFNGQYLPFDVLHFCLFLSILSFRFLNWFRTKTIWCYNYCPIIQVTATFFLPLWEICIASKNPLSFFRTSFLLEMGSSLKRYTFKKLIVGIFQSEIWSINWNELKRSSTGRIMGFRLPSESIGKPSMMSSITPAPSPKLVILPVLWPELPSQIVKSKRYSRFRLVHHILYPKYIGFIPVDCFRKVPYPPKYSTMHSSISNSLSQMQWAYKFVKVLWHMSYYCILSGCSSQQHEETAEYFQTCPFSYFH